MTGTSTSSLKYTNTFTYHYLRKGLFNYFKCGIFKELKKCCFLNDLVVDSKSLRELLSRIEVSALQIGNRDVELNQSNHEKSLNFV